MFDGLEVENIFKDANWCVGLLDDFHGGLQKNMIRMELTFCESVNDIG